MWRKALGKVMDRVIIKVMNKAMSKEMIKILNKASKRFCREDIIKEGHDERHYH